VSAGRPRDRGFGFVEHFAVWATLGASLYAMPFGSLLVPAMSIERAFLATAVASFVAALLIAAIATAAVRTGASTLDLISAPFGGVASTPLALLLVVRNVAFAAFALSLMAESAALVSERALGEGLRPLWVVVFGIAAGYVVKLGPKFVVEKLLKRGVWIVLLLALVIAGSAYMEFEIPSYLRRPAAGGWPSFWQGVDIMLVVPLLWLPVIADLARFGQDTRSAGAGSFLGTFLMTLWFGTLGVIYLPATESGDIAGFVAGMNMSLGALVLLFLLQADEIFASGSSAVAALEALPVPGLRWPAPAALVTLAAVLVALPGGLLQAEGTFLLVGSIFIPLFGTVIGDQILGRAEMRFAPLALLSWALGFVVYQWISPPEAGWWLDVTRWFFGNTLSLPYPLTEEVTWLGAAIPSFLVAFTAQLTGGAFLWLVNPGPVAPGRTPQ